MKKTRLWLIVVAAVMSLVTFIAGCAKASSNGVTFSIANKTELQAAWFEEGDDREVKLKMPSEITENDVTVTSSNPAAVLVETEERDGKKVFILKAAGAGISKITATAFDEKDSLNITVKQAIKEITVTNKSALGKIVNGEERTVEYSVKPDAFDVENANVEITSSDTGVITVNGNKIKAVGKGTATLTVKAGKFSDSVEISVIDLSAPSFTAEDGAVVNGLAGDGIKLPSALSCDGSDLRANVTAECPDGIAFDNDTMTVKSSATGSYKVKLSVSDPRNSALTASLEITVGVYRKIFADYNGYGNIGYESYAEGKQYVADSEQVTSFDRWDATFASFDMQPSKIYYAEMVVDSASKADWSTFYGMTHSVKGDATRWLTAYMDRGAAVTREPEEGEESRYYSGARDFRIKDIDIVNDTNCWELHNGNQPRSQILYTYGLNRFRGIDNIDSFPCKLATARIGGFFYYFVNDYYVCAVTNSYLQDKDTVPGYFQQSSIGTDIKNIVWLSGTEAEAKFNTLTDNGSKLFSEFAPSQWWKNENQASEHISHSTDALLGANYTFDTSDLTGENKGIVTPYIFFDGNFTFEWEYQFDAASPSGDWDRFMALEVRHLRDENSSWDSNYSNKYAFLFGGMRQDGDSDICAMVKCFSKDKPNDWDWERPAMEKGGKEWYSNSQKLRYRVTRICCVDGKGNPVAKYTFTIERPDGSERSVWTYDDYGLDKWKSPCEPVILLWKNKGVKGTYSNVKYSIPEVPASSLSIADKDALTAKWTVGDDDRTVVTDISGVLVGPANVTSSNSQVISVDGNVLTAVGAGTATITVAIGSYKDTVEITVLPALAGVTISNKDALKDIWKISSSATRAVEIAFSPAEVYNSDNTDVTITSSNTSVITVSGSTLNAVGVGRTTVTVKAGELTDTVEITVISDKPAIALDGSVVIYGEVGGTVTLPEYSVISVEGDEVADPQVTITCDSGDVTVNGREFVATATGEYTVKYSYSGADDATATVYVYRKVISSVYAEDDEVAVEYTQNADCIVDEKQVITLNTTKNTYAQLNMAAGKSFYAEATFIVANQGNNNNYYGIYAAATDDKTRYLAAMTDRGNKSEPDANNRQWNRAVKIVDFDTTKSGWTDVSQTKFWCRNVFEYGQKITETAEDRVTVAMARIDDIFYMFIDGQVVMGFTAKDYNGKDMTAGIFQKNAVAGTRITAINYLTGNEAQTKFNQLTANGSKLMGEYRPNSWWDETNSASGYMISSDEADKGANFTFSNPSAGENAGIVTPNVSFDGDFNFEWEFKFAEGTTGGNWNKYMRVELRTAENSDWGFRFNATAQVNGNDNLCIGAVVNEDHIENGETKDTHDLGGYWLNDSGYAGQYKFSISRKITDNKANITFKAWKQNDGGTYELIYDKSWEGTEVKQFGDATQPAIVVIKSVNVAGEYTNVKWSATAEQN